jgi:DNA polymerase III subunit beta
LFITVYHISNYPETIDYNHDFIVFHISTGLIIGITSMELIVKKEILLKPLSYVVGVVEKRQTLPILGNVYLQASSAKLTLIGTDLETEITTFIEGLDSVDGELTVGARKLFDIVRSMPDSAEIKLDAAQENKVVVSSGRTRFTLQTLPAKEFPKLEVSDWDAHFSVSRSALSGLLASTQFAMAQQDVRYFLNGLLFEIEQGVLRAVATDGHRLARSEIAVPGIQEASVQRIVPRKAVLEMQRFLSSEDEGDVEVKINANHISVSTDGLMFISKLIDGRFPDYNSVIPANLSKHISLDRQEFIDVLVRAAILSNEKFKGISLTLESGLLKVSSNNPEQEQANDEMVVDYSDEAVEVGFNVNYVLDALRNLDTKEVVLGLQDANTSCTVKSPKNENTLYLIMPMRL